MARAIITQTEEEYKCNIHNNEKIKKEWKLMESKEINIYENQQKSGEELVEYFETNREKILSLVILEPQGGKTGILCSSIKEFMNIGTPYENIFIITGLSSIEWKKQTQNRIPLQLHKNIYHRQDLEKNFIENIKGKQNVLILIDEIQIACKELQTLANIFEKANLFDINTLLKNDIKIIQFSATPNGILYDTKSLEKKHSFIKVCKPGINYIGCKELLETERIYDITEGILKDNIKKHLHRFKTPKFHFIRIHKGESIKFIIDFIKDFSDCDYIEYTQDGIKPEELDEILLEEPDLHTFIFIKERARCAKTFNKKHIGIWYERYGKIILDDVITQGLLGRACGYDDNGESIIFTHKKSIENYIKLIDSDFKDLEIIWTSNSTFVSDNIIESKGTLNYLINKVNNTQNIKSKICNTFEESCDWLKEYNPKLRKFNNMCCNSKGYYNGGSVSKYKVIEYKDININKTLSKNDTHKLVRCYIDKKNIETLIYVIYYEENEIDAK